MFNLAIDSKLRTCPKSNRSSRRPPAPRRSWPAHPHGSCGTRPQRPTCVSNFALRLLDRPGLREIVGARRLKVGVADSQATIEGASRATAHSNPRVWLRKHRSIRVPRCRPAAYRHLPQSAHGLSPRSGAHEPPYSVPRGLVGQRTPRTHPAR